MSVHQGEPVDLAIIGAGPAGQKAAVQAAKEGRRVLLIERDADVGGECVQRGTIPSKTLRQSAEMISGLRRKLENVIDVELGGDTKVEALMRHLDRVLSAHGNYMRNQLERNHIEVLQGRARFHDEHTVEVLSVDGSVTHRRAEVIVIATGSRPRNPPGLEVDHEQVLDSDSILSMIYLPKSLCVLGGGVIACEFATLFQALGVKVTQIDRGPRPLGFLDPELTDALVGAFHGQGGTFLAGRKPVSIERPPMGKPIVHLEDGETIEAEKVLVALGRVATLDGLGLDKIGLETTERGHLPVDEHGRTAIPHIYAVGDVIGPPALAATAMDQGRRAARHALGLPLAGHGEFLPVGIYAIPEIACVGLDEKQAEERAQAAGEAAPLIGRSRFDELARGQINGDTEGMLKLVCDGSGERILGVHVVGHQATELVHLGQMALIAGLPVDTFVNNTFNFPTLAEAYRVAALDVIGQRTRLSQAA